MSLPPNGHHDRSTNVSDSDSEDEVWCVYRCFLISHTSLFSSTSCLTHDEGACVSFPYLWWQSWTNSWRKQTLMLKKKKKSSRQAGVHLMWLQMNLKSVYVFHLFTAQAAPQSVLPVHPLRPVLWFPHRCHHHNRVPAHMWVTAEVYFISRELGGL